MNANRARNVEKTMPGEWVLRKTREADEEKAQKELEERQPRQRSRKIQCSGGTIKKKVVTVRKEKILRGGK